MAGVGVEPGVRLGEVGALEELVGMDMVDARVGLVDVGVGVGMGLGIGGGGVGVGAGVEAKLRVGAESRMRLAVETGVDGPAGMGTLRDTKMSLNLQ